MIYKDKAENTLFICKLAGDTAGFREGQSAEEVRLLYPEVVEAYQLTEAQEAEIVAAWEGYWAHSRDMGNEQQARRVLSAIVRSVYQRAKEEAST